MQDWEIQILNLNGTPKVAYNNNNPGGIVTSISFDVEPSGNCLTASFRGIPNKLDIAPRDFVQIRVGGVNKFFGYFTNHFNQNSSEVVTYNIEGAKSLLYDHLIDEWWFRGNPTLGDDEEKLVDHRQIVAGLQSALPYYVSSTIDNAASVLSGNKPPILAADYSFGDLLDSIIAAASDDLYVWGVDANRRVFVKPYPDSLIDLDAVSKRVKYNSQNTDTIVTAVKFQFTIPTAFLGEGMTQHLYKTDDAGLDPATHPVQFLLGVRDDMEGGWKSFEYEDPASVGEFGKFTRKVPLVLSDMWMREVSISQYLSENPTVAFSLVNSNSDWETNTSATSETALRTALETPGAYIRNSKSSPFFNLFLEFERGSANSFEDNILGIVYDYEVEASPSHYIRAGRNTLYRNAQSPYPRTANSPIRDTHTYDASDGASELSYQKLRLVYFSRSLRGWLNSPDALSSAGRPLRELRGVHFHFGLNRFVGGGNVAPNTLRLKDVKLLTYNTEALTNYAKTFLKSPIADPSEVTVTQDLGLAARATLNSNESHIVRVRTTISRDEGFAVSYVIGDDPLRNNQQFTRLFDRDNKATLNAIDVSMGRV